MRTLFSAALGVGLCCLLGSAACGPCADDSESCLALHIAGIDQLEPAPLQIHFTDLSAAIIGRVLTDPLSSPGWVEIRPTSPRLVRGASCVHGYTLDRQYGSQAQFRWPDNGPARAELTLVDSGNITPSMTTTEKTILAAAGCAVSLAVGAVDDDQSADLIIGCRDDPQNTGRPGVQVLLGPRVWESSHSRSVELPFEPSALVLSDLDGDGHAELIAGSATSGTLVVRSGRDLNAETRLVLLGKPLEQWAVKGISVGHVNADSAPELAIIFRDVGTSQTGLLGILLNSGQGNLAWAGEYATIPAVPEGVLLGRFLKDRQPGIVVTSLSLKSSPQFFKVDMRGALSVLRGTQVDGSPGTALPAYVDELDTPDGAKLLIPENNDSKGTLRRVRVWTPNSLGSLSPAEALAVSDQPRVVAVADFNGDQIPDLAVGHFEGIPQHGVVSYIAGNRDGSFAQTPMHTAPVSTVIMQLFSGDFDGDCRPDLAIIGQPGNQITLLLTRPAR